MTLAAGAGTCWHGDPAPGCPSARCGERTVLPSAARPGAPAMEPPRARGPRRVLPRGRRLWRGLAVAAVV